MTHGRRTPRWWLMGGALLLPLYGVYVLAMAFTAPKPAPKPEFAPGFAGSAACAECHADIAREQGKSHHAETLHEAPVVEKTTTLPEPVWMTDPDLPASYRITHRNEQLGVEAQSGGAVAWQPMHWGFGSGYHGITFVGRTPDNQYVESALTYYRRAGWDFTVGFLNHPPAERQKKRTGDVLTASEIYDCFHCHSAGVRQSPAGVVLQGMEQGVRCESCHGPSAAHVKAAREGRPREGIRSLQGLTAKEQVALCGECHRSTAPPGLHPNNPVLARFAPVGLQRSRCFKESNGRLSCVSCHSPHTDAATVSTSYNAVCGSCHGAQPAQKACPRQPKGDCVSCHMPKQIIQRNSIFTDHWIRVVKQLNAS